MGDRTKLIHYDKGENMFKEFKEFAMRGNVVDMAIGIIIGGAFGKIVTSMVNDIIMPPIGLVLGRVDFSSLFHQPVGNALRYAGGRQEGRSCRDQLRRLPQHGHRFLDRGFRDLPSGETDEPDDEAGTSSRRAAHQGMSLLRVRRNCA